MIIELDEEYYGKYKMKLVAVYDQRRFPVTEYKPHHMGEKSSMNYFDANTEFRKICGAFNLVEIPTPLDPKGDRTFAIFSPIEGINDEWFKQSKECGYVKATNGKVKKFPLSASNKKWDKFFEKCPSMKPEKEFSTIEEVRQHYFNEPGIKTKPKM